MGYSHLDSRNSTYSRYGKTKRQLVNEMRKARKIGNLPPVYPNGWFALLESNELKRKQAKYVSALGENFAVFRSESGQVHVLDAYCPHLGANMAIGGFVRGDCIECPFHQWQFSGEDGRCVNIPYSGKGEVFLMQFLLVFLSRLSSSIEKIFAHKLKPRHLFTVHGLNHEIKRYPFISSEREFFFRWHFFNLPVSNFIVFCWHNFTLKS